MDHAPFLVAVAWISFTPIEPNFLAEFISLPNYCTLEAHILKTKNNRNKPISDPKFGYI